MIDERKDKLGEQSEEQVNIQELLFRYLIHWPWFVVSIIICIACAWGYLRLTTPIYNISATVLIKDEKKGGGASMSSDLEKMGLEGFVSSSSNVDNEIEVLRSKSLAREVVNNLGLFVTYMDEDEFPSKELYHTSPVLVSLTHQEADKLPGRMEINMILQPTGALGVQITVGEKEYRKQFDKLPAVFPTDEGTIAFFANNDTLSAVCPENITKERHITAFINRPFSVLKEYVSSLSIAPTSKTTSVVVISLENTNTRRGRDYINKLLEMYNINANNDKNEVAQKTAEFIDERIGIISKELGSTEQDLENFKRSAGITDLSSEAQIALTGNAEYEKKRVENLLAAGAANQKQLDDWDAQVKLLERQLVAQESSLQNSTNSLIEQGNSVAIQVAQMEDQLAKCHVQSPIEGTVLAKYAEAGELAAIGKPLFKVAEVDRMYLRAYITSEQLSQVKLGDEVTVYADYGNSEQKAYPGVVTWISDRSEFTPKTILTKNERANLVYAVKIAVKNDGALKIGMYGGVTLKN